MRFSILTVTRNRAATLATALDSLDAQTYPDWEHIVQDGASTDATTSLLAARADPRRDVLSARDGGIYDALNKALTRGTGDVVGVLHSDDFYANAYVLERVAAQFARTGADAIYGDLQYVSASDPSKIVRHWRSGNYDPRALRWGWMPPHPALFIRRHVFDRWGGYDTNFRISADYDAILRYFSHGRISAAWLPEVIVKMRIGGESNRSLGRILLKSREDLSTIRRHGVGGAEVLIAKNLSKITQFFRRDRNHPFNEQ